MFHSGKWELFEMEAGFGCDFFWISSADFGEVAAKRIPFILISFHFLDYIKVPL
jgi:hypothetical protein